MTVASTRRVARYAALPPDIPPLCLRYGPPANLRQAGDKNAPGQWRDYEMLPKRQGCSRSLGERGLISES